MTATTYHRVDAPRYASMIEHDCAECGHEALARPVFLATPAGATIAVGTGCAAKLLGVKVTTLAADLAADEIIALAADNCQARQAWYDLLITLPARITPKYMEWLTGRNGEVAEKVADLYKIVKKDRNPKEVRP